MALGGIQTLELATRDFDDVCRKDLSPYEKLEMLSGLGVLDTTSFPSTGPEHTAWNVNILVTRMRSVLFRMRKVAAINTRDEFPMDAEALGLFEEMVELLSKLPDLAQKRAEERSSAERALRMLEG